MIDSPIRKVYTDTVLLNLDNSIEGKFKNSMDKNTLLLDFVEAWLELFKKNSIKPASYSRLLCSKNALGEYDISRKPIGEINFFDLQKYLNDIVQKGYSMSNVKKQLEIVTAPLKKAAAIRIIQTDPCVGIELPIE